MPAGQCVEPLSNGHKKISFNSPPTPNRTRNTINECYLGKRGHVIPLLSGLRPPLLGGTTINSFGNDYRNLANLGISNAKLQSSQCGNSRIILPLRNYVKSILGMVKLQEPATLTFLEVLNLISMNFCIFWRQKFTNMRNSELLKLQKGQFLNLYNPQN